MAMARPRRTMALILVVLIFLVAAAVFAALTYWLDGEPLSDGDSAPDAGQGAEASRLVAQPVEPDDLHRTREMMRWDPPSRIA
jgi:hypothetical protein